VYPCTPEYEYSVERTYTFMEANIEAYRLFKAPADEVRNEQTVFGIPAGEYSFGTAYTPNDGFNHTGEQDEEVLPVFLWL
jgi:hypothetical protein